MTRRIRCAGKRCMYYGGETNNLLDSTFFQVVHCRLDNIDKVMGSRLGGAEFCEGYKPKGEDELISLFTCEKCGYKERFSNSEIMGFEKNKNSGFSCPKCRTGYNGFHYFMNRSPLLLKHKILNFLAAILALILIVILLTISKK